MQVLPCPQQWCLSGVSGWTSLFTNYVNPCVNKGPSGFCWHFNAGSCGRKVLPAESQCGRNCLASWSLPVLWQKLRPALLHWNFQIRCNILISWYKVKECLFLLSEQSSYVEFSVDTKINSAYKWGLWITQVISTSWLCNSIGFKNLNFWIVDVAIYKEPQ